MFQASGKIVFNHINEIVRKMDGRASILADEMAERIKRGGESRARRVSGEMAGAFEVRGHGEHREVVNTSDHFIYNELGTRKMAAQPMLTPAAIDEQLSMESSAKRAFEEVL